MNQLEDFIDNKENASKSNQYSNMLKSQLNKIIVNFFDDYLKNDESLSDLIIYSIISTALTNEMIYCVQTFSSSPENFLTNLNAHAETIREYFSQLIEREKKLLNKMN